MLLHIIITTSTQEYFIKHTKQTNNIRGTISPNLVMAVALIAQNWAKKDRTATASEAAEFLLMLENEK